MGEDVTEPVTHVKGLSPIMRRYQKQPSRPDERSEIRAIIPALVSSVGWAKARSAVPTKLSRQTPMSRYRRLKIEGGAFFFTLALADRGSDLLVRHIERLRSAYAAVERRYPFETVAICILPDHIRALW